MMLPYELRIGVTGHRNLAEEDLGSIEHAVGRLLTTIGDMLGDAGARPYGPHGSQRDLKQQCQLLLADALRAVKLMRASPREVPPARQTPVDWVVVSPLAKGADRIVAKAVLALADEKITRTPKATQPPRLEVILPMPVEEYRKDFDTDEDRREFDELFAPAERSGAVTTLNPDFTTHQYANPHEARRAAYESVGRAVVEGCEILMAVWNGKPAQGRDGTADIVRYAVDAGRLVLWIDSDHPTAEARVLRRRTEKDLLPATGGVEDFECRLLPTRAKEFSTAYHRLPLHSELDQLAVQIIDPRPYPGAEEWFESAFRPVLTRLRRELTQQPAIGTLQKIVDSWIRGQADWHRKKIERHEKGAHQFHLAGWLTFAATLMMAVLHVAGVGHGDTHDPHATLGLLGQSITLLAIVLPAVGAAIHACAVLRDHDRLAARSKQLEPVLRGLADRARAASTRTELARVVAEADHVMAEENDDWWVTLGGQAPVMPG
ncbi:MAG: hypothetical protein JNM18_09700 [Planctomycetaceae bacterium]|nr:hypothetical protein [Planctomycetaceae bacterium]